jgi:thymidylate synthase
MRIFKAFPEAFEEIRRDLKEMGIPVHTKTMQDKAIAEDADFSTLELQNYGYTVTNPKYEDLTPSQPWADADWVERMSGALGKPVNPGRAWELRREVWEEFLHGGKFAYTYAERLSQFEQVKNVIRALKADNNSRQLYVSMWHPMDSMKLGQFRVPCSLGWLFQYRRGQLDVTYMMRSCDFHTHFQNDIFMSMKLRDLIAAHAGLTPGFYSHFMGSLHVYSKDVAEVF